RRARLPASPRGVGKRRVFLGSGFRSQAIANVDLHRRSLRSGGFLFLSSFFGELFRQHGLRFAPQQRRAEDQQHGDGEQQQGEADRPLEEDHGIAARDQQGAPQILLEN